MSRRVRSRRGAAAMEFALWLPVLFLLLSAVVDWGYYMSQRVSVARATMDGCRIGAAWYEIQGGATPVAPGSESAPKAQARIITVLNGLGLPCGVGCSVTAQYCAAGDGGSCQSPPFNGIVCSTTYGFTPFFGFASAPATISEDFMMAVLNQ